MNKKSTTVVGTTTPATYTGIYLRNNLSSTGQTAESTPLDLCPDIIQSDSPIPDFQDTLSSQSSWGQMYGVEPSLGSANYYYVRGMNGASSAVTGTAALYWAPAQVFNFPSAWQNNPMTTAGGASTVNVAASAGHIAVGNAAFVWTPEALDGSSTYYNFIGQSVSSGAPNPVPTVASWLDLSALVGQDPGFGFRNQAMVDGSAGATWVQRQALAVPSSFSSSATLFVTVSASGFAGAKVGFLCDLFSPEGNVIALEPTAVEGDGVVVGTTITLDPGYASSLAVQCWNPPGGLAPGATLTLTFSYSLPTGAETAEAMKRGLLHSRHVASVSTALGLQPTPVVLVGTLSFTAAAPVVSAGLR